MLQMETWTAPAHNTIYYLFPNVYARKCKNVICPVHCEFQIRPGQCWNNEENSISSILVNGGLWAGRPVWRTIQQSARVNPHKLKLIMTELNSKFIEMEWPSPVSFLRSFCDVVAAAARRPRKRQGQEQQPFGSVGDIASDVVPTHSWPKESGRILRLPRITRVLY